MSTDTSESLSISTTDPFCDLCGCIQPHRQEDEVEDIRLATQAIVRLCELVNETSSTLQYKFAEMIAKQDSFNQAIAQLKRDHATLLQRLACIGA